MVNFKYFSINGTTRMLKLSTCVCELEPEDHILWDVENMLYVEDNGIALIPVGAEDIVHFPVPSGFRTG